VSAAEPAPRGPHDAGERASRYHTARGPMPASGWLRLPAARLRSRLGRVPERPWIVPAAIGWLGRRVRRDWRVLELGSGRSTLWLAKRAGSVLSFEDNSYWQDRASGLLEQAGLDNAEVRSLPVRSFADEIAGLPDHSFDLLVVDFLEAPDATRVEAVRAGRDKVRPRGYAEAHELLSGWRERRFTGVKDEWPAVCETTIFQSPPPASPASP